jgi:hypothetical protein
MEWIETKNQKPNSGSRIMAKYEHGITFIGNFVIFKEMDGFIERWFDQFGDERREPDYWIEIIIPQQKIIDEKFKKKC